MDLNGDGVPDTTIPNPLPAPVLAAATGPANVSVCGVSFRSANASPWAGNFQAEYNMPIFNEASEAFLRGLVTYNGSARNDEQNSFDDVGDRALVNLYAGVRDADGAWDISVYRKNNLFR